jgi:hypothetical protein
MEIAGTYQSRISVISTPTSLLCCWREGIDLDAMGFGGKTVGRGDALEDDG